MIGSCPFLFHDVTIIEDRLVLISEPAQVLYLAVVLWILVA
jgi:hypothetical protein